MKKQFKYADFDVAFVCKRGCNRSGQICCAYIAMLTGWSLDDVIDHVRALRPGLGLEECGPRNRHSPKEWLKKVWGDLQQLRATHSLPIWEIARPAINTLDEISRTGEN